MRRSPHDLGALDSLSTMTAPQRALTAGILAWARQRRFPTLLLTIGTIFVVDLVVPDLIPFVDELLLGLATLVLARWKDRRTQPTSTAD